MKESIVCKLFEIWKKQGDIMWDGINNFFDDGKGYQKSIDYIMIDVIMNAETIGNDLIEYLEEE